MLTKKGLENLLKAIFSTGGLTDDMEQLVKRLKDDFDEREGILAKYRSEGYDPEAEEYEFIEKTVNDEDADYWRNEAETYKKRYIDRFFGDEEIVEKEEDETIITNEDGGEEIKTYDELLEREED